MQRCLDEVVAVLRKYDLGVTLCLASDRESVLMYRIPEWCAVALSDNGPEVNPEKLWQTDDLESLLFRTYRLANSLRQMNERLQGCLLYTSSRLESRCGEAGQQRWIAGKQMRRNLPGQVAPADHRRRLMVAQHQKQRIRRRVLPQVAAKHRQVVADAANISCRQFRPIQRLRRHHGFRRIGQDVHIAPIGLIRR